MNYADLSSPVEGIQVVNDIIEQKGINTIEGKIGPLIWGAISQTYFVDMPPGAYLEEHPHPFEALIYAVRGRYVLCAHGVRTLMEPGSLMAFAANVPTGYEVPFDESAFILVFRSGKPELDQIAFMARLQEDEPASLHDLPDDHPARIYARTVNPAF